MPTQVKTETVAKLRERLGTAKTAVLTEYRGLTVTDLANLREGPGTKAKILRVLRKGTTVTVLEEKDQWFRVRLDDGREGWIAESVAAE